MSLFFGVLGNISEIDNVKLNKFTEGYVSINFPNGNVYIRQKDQNICYYQDENKGFVISGIGLEATSSGFKKLDVKSWGKYVYNPFNVSFPDGHYCGISWINNKVYLFNDILGIKHIYTKKVNENLYFGNNLSIIKKITNSYTINKSELYATWFLNAKINYKPLFEGIDRISGIYEFEKSLPIEKYEHEWIPNFESNVTIYDFDSVLEKLLQFGINEFEKLSLGLTAGLDSRLLLSYLLKFGKNNWVTHTFGDSNLPDIIYSKNISNKLGFTQNIYDYEIPDKNTLINTLGYYVSYTNIVIPISETIQFGMHRRFGDPSILVIDGSYGETYRRQMLNKLLIAGKNAIYKKDYKKIYEYIKSTRPNIFKEEENSIIEESIYNSISQIYEIMPSLKDISLENWLDVFAIKIKMPNTTAFSQQCLDSICSSITIFLQPTLLKVGISLPLEERINGRMFRTLIKKNAPILTNFPLVKNNYSYPFNFGNKASYIYTKIKSKILNSYKWTLNENILNLGKEFLLDTINSKSFRDDDLLNHNLIENAANKFYSGKIEYKTILEWYYTYFLMLNERE